MEFAAIVATMVRITIISASSLSTDVAVRASRFQVILNDSFIKSDF